MIDIVDAVTRSRMMSGIRGKNTRPEIALRRALHARGLRYSLHGNALPGKPDIVFTKFRAVCLVHGCFWHRHAGCRFASTPKTREGFWEEKFATNVARDLKVRADLARLGWRVAVIWECSIRKAPDLAEIADRVADWLRSSSGDFEA